MAKKKKKTRRKLSPYNRHVQREMKKGRSMKQAAASWRRGGKSPSKKPTRGRVTGTYVKKGKRYAIRHNPSRQAGRKVGKSGFNQQKLFKLARMAALLGPHAAVLMSAAPIEQKIQESVKMLSGFDMATGQLDFEALKRGYGPLLVTTGVTAVIPKINAIIRGIF